MIRFLAILYFFAVYRLAESSLTLSRRACRCQTLPVDAGHSHSIVAGGFELTSYVTRDTPEISLIMRFETVSRSS